MKRIFGLGLVVILLISIAVFAAKQDTSVAKSPITSSLSVEKQQQLLKALLTEEQLQKLQSLPKDPLEAITYVAKQLQTQQVD